MVKTQQYSKEEAVVALQEAKEELGKSPSVQEYAELGLKPSAKTIRSSIFDSWNSAKEKASLETNISSDLDNQKVPDLYDMSLEEWKDKGKYVRSSMRKRSYWAKEKVNRGCKRCGYDENSAALEWHHSNSKEKKQSVSRMINHNRDNKDIRKEVEKCVVLCSNCHNIETYSHFAF